ncbi:MAG TPA: glycosyltransferase family 9 protein [bacterium]
MASTHSKSESAPKGPSRILVMRYSSLGDVALTNPLLDRLGHAFPGAEIFFATKKEFAPVVKHHPALTRMILLEGKGFFNFWNHLGEIRQLKPTLVLDLHNSLRTHAISMFLKDAKLLVYDKESLERRLLVKKLRQEASLHTIQKYLKVLEPLGVFTPIRVPFEIHVSKKNKEFLKDFLERRKISSSQQVVGLGPGAKWFTKRWQAERYADLASRLVEDYRCRLFWFGSPDEAPLVKAIQARMRGTPLERGISLAGEYSLEQSIALLGRSDLFIGNDSGLTHLASGRGCRVVVLYGSTTPSLGFEPWGPHSVVEVSGLDCRPCDVHGRDSCPLGHFKCMEELTVDLVEGAVKRSLRRNH